MVGQIISASTLDSDGSTYFLPLILGIGSCGVVSRSEMSLDFCQARWINFAPWNEGIGLEKSRCEISCMHIVNVLTIESRQLKIGSIASGEHV